jgi:hypothetical protein
MIVIRTERLVRESTEAVTALRECKEHAPIMQPQHRGVHGACPAEVDAGVAGRILAARSRNRYVRVNS